MIDKLLKEYQDKNAQTVELLNYYEVHIMPVVNPDGMISNKKNLPKYFITFINISPVQLINN